MKSVSLSLSRRHPTRSLSLALALTVGAGLPALAVGAGLPANPPALDPAQATATATYPTPGWAITDTSALTGAWIGTAKDIHGEIQPIWCLAPDEPMRLICYWHAPYPAVDNEAGILYSMGKGMFNWSRFGNGEANSQCDLMVIAGVGNLAGGVV